MHSDDSEVTMNINLLDGFEGADLSFCGVAGTVEHRRLKANYSHSRGRCVMHAVRMANRIIAAPITPWRLHASYSTPIPSSKQFEIASKIHSHSSCINSTMATTFCTYNTHTILQYNPFLLTSHKNCEHFTGIPPSRCPGTDQGRTLEPDCVDAINGLSELTSVYAQDAITRRSISWLSLCFQNPWSRLPWLHWFVRMIW